MKLYDRHTSPNCQRTRVVLYEKNITFETIPVDRRFVPNVGSSWARKDQYILPRGGVPKAPASSDSISPSVTVALA